MQTRTIILCTALFCALVAGMFIFTYLTQREAPITVSRVATTTISTSALAPINATHYYVDGVHTFVGQIDMPTPCDLLQAQAVVQETMPEQVQLNFTTINNDPGCSNVVTAQRFKVEARATKDAIISATLRGVPVELNLTPAPRGELPEQFELFIKG